jgi:AbrB family looped-hinge helix DNA binding protein
MGVVARSVEASDDLTGKIQERSAPMAALATTKLSSKGQVVIPEEIRTALGLEPGVQFVVLGEGDVVILKRIAAPERKEFRALAVKVRGQARRAGLKATDVKAAVREVRRRG